jgi:hypothetical protein
VRAGLLSQLTAGQGGAPRAKKLKDAARIWATGGAPAIDEENTLAALKKFNATPEQLEKVREQFQKRRQGEGFGIWPENWRAFELFMACGDQWTIHCIPGPVGAPGIVRYQGIDFRILDSVEARMPPSPGTEVPEPRDLFRQFRLLVQEAAAHLNQG